MSCSVLVRKSFTLAMYFSSNSCWFFVFAMEASRSTMLSLFLLIFDSLMKMVVRFESIFFWLAAI